MPAGIHQLLAPVDQSKIEIGNHHALPGTQRFTQQFAFRRDNRRKAATGDRTDAASSILHDLGLLSGVEPGAGVNNEAAGFKLAALDLKGLSIELLEPLGEHSFLYKFLEKRGEGMHHLTFNVPDCKQKTADLKEQGVRIVDEHEWSPTSFESFISPRSSHGVLIQLGSGYPTLNSDPTWTRKK